MVEINAPLAVNLQITSRCNLRCKYCYADLSLSVDMSIEKISEIIKILHEKKVFQVQIEGGEPFLHPNIFEIIEICLKHNTDLTILSNGTQIGEKEAKKLKGFEKIYYPFSIQISLDSHIPSINNSVRGESDKVINAINKLAEAGFANIIIATVIHNKNINVAEKIIDCFYPKIKKFHLMNLMPTKNSLEYKNFLFVPNNQKVKLWQLLEKKKDNHQKLFLSFPCNSKKVELKGTAQCRGCFGGTTRIAIKPNLDIIPCPLAPNFVMGNLNNATFDEIWYSKIAEEVRNKPVSYCRLEEEIILNNQPRSLSVLS